MDVHTSKSISPRAARNAHAAQSPTSAAPTLTDRITASKRGIKNFFRKFQNVSSSSSAQQREKEEGAGGGKKEMQTTAAHKD